jgi:nicotinamidase-related amidase
MSETSSVHTSLLSLEDTCLVVIDVQNIFLEKLPDDDRDHLIQRILWTVNVAMRLGVPIVVTAEDIDKNGSIIPELDALLPSETYVYDKLIFGLADDDSIVEAIKATKRRVPILIGLETDVCVAQSAIGLVNIGYHVVIVEDACSSPGQAHARGLKRMENAGVLISNVKALFYEWLRTVEDTRAFYKKYKDEVDNESVPL